MRTKKCHAALPVGHAARLAYEIDAVRGACCAAAQAIAASEPVDFKELEECACLDEALVQAQRILKRAVRNVMIARLNRRSRRALE